MYFFPFAPLSPFTPLIWWHQGKQVVAHFLFCSIISLFPGESVSTKYSIVQLRVSYLWNYLQPYRARAVAPYVWSCRSDYGPFQCAFLTMVYLNHFRDAEDIKLADTASTRSLTTACQTTKARTLPCRETVPVTPSARSHECL